MKTEIKKVYVYKVRGGICAEVRTRTDGKADVIIATQGKTYAGMSPNEAFEMAKSRQRLER